MLRHYVTNILPNGYKAQVVAYSRLAAVRYYKAFIDARDKLLFDAERLPEELKGCDNETLVVSLLKYRRWSKHGVIKVY